jgi:7-cyano-7-deazaguanine synthase
MTNAIVLCSGGIDSVTTVLYAKKKLRYDQITILFFNYGQKSLSAERKSSKACAKMVEGRFIEVELKFLKKVSTSLINIAGSGKRLKKSDLADTSKESKKFYVPCRNTIFLTHALALADSEFIKKKEVCDILVGFKNEGRESYPDTTKKYVKLMIKLSKNACLREFRIIAPVINMDKEDIIKLGNKLGADYSKTHSCYIENTHCGHCLACKLRQAGFYWANVSDPTKYKQK